VVDATMGVHRPDGELAWLRVNSTPVRDAAGAVISAVTVFADVTVEIEGRARNEQLEAELRLSEMTARVSLDGLDHGVVLMDPSGTIHRMNAAAERLLGYDAAELTAKWRSPSWTTYDENGAELAAERRPIQIAITTGEPVSGRVIVWRRRDGRPVTLRVSVTPVDDGSGQMVVGLADITAERIAVAQFRSAFDDAPIGMVLVDADSAIVEANAAFATLTGQPGEHLVGMQVTSLCHPDDVAVGEAAWTKLFRHRVPIQLDQRFVRPDGSIVRASVHTSPVGNEIGPAFAIAQVLDITEQHRHEAELAHLATHDPLTGLVNRRAFAGTLNEHINRCRRYGADGVVMVLDLDNFKQINDTFGHSAGDRVIVSIADALTRRLRASDVVCRLGGDEFAVLLPTGDIEQGRTVATSVLEALRDELAALGAIAAEAAASIGLAAVERHHRCGDEVVADADSAMYDAKQAGGDRFTIFAPRGHDGKPTTSRATWIDDIDQALDHDHFRLLEHPAAATASVQSSGLSDGSWS
jgi:diguanylate cyclase (GGDEF)-like protein/PAS domain S-box-containing protein